MTLTKKSIYSPGARDIQKLQVGDFILTHEKSTIDNGDQIRFWERSAIVTHVQRNADDQLTEIASRQIDFGKKKDSKQDGFSIHSGEDQIHTKDQLQKKLLDIRKSIISKELAGGDLKNKNIFQSFEIMLNNYEKNQSIIEHLDQAIHYAKKINDHPAIIACNKNRLDLTESMRTHLMETILRNNNDILPMYNQLINQVIHVTRLMDGVTIQPETQEKVKLLQVTASFVPTLPGASAHPLAHSTPSIRPR